MPNKNWKWLAICAVIVLMTAGCGGGGGSNVAGPSQPEAPAQPEPAPINPVPPEPGTTVGLGKLELLTGKVFADLTNCRSIDGSAAVAEYSQLLRATVYEDGVYLAETGEGCANVDSSAIRKLSGGVVETAIALNSGYLAIPEGPPPVMVRYPSGFQRDKSTGEPLVLSYAAAHSGQNFALDEQEVARYTAQGMWNYYPPGLFRFIQSAEMGAADGRLVAGTPGKPPGYLDGQGQAAGFVAPHDLEMDDSGLLYLIDDGRVRTVDADAQVKTLDLAALGVEGDVLALDSDPQGGIHALTRRNATSYSWYRLTDGSRVDFGGGLVFPEFSPPQSVTFAVVGNDLLFSGVQAGASQISRISSDGAITLLTPGSGTPATPQELLDNPSQYKLPPVQHLEYGVDGSLYIVLQQGVLVSRNFR